MTRPRIDADECEFLAALLEQLIIETGEIDRSTSITMLQEALVKGIRLYDDDIGEAADAAGIEDSEAVMDRLEDRDVIDRWTETSYLAPMSPDEGLDEEDRAIEKRMLSIDADVVDRLLEEL